MTTTGTTTPEILSSRPPGPPEQRVITAVGIVVFTGVALTQWLFTTSSETETGPVAAASAAASPGQVMPAPGRADAGANAGSVDRPEAFAQFCWNSPTLCGPAEPTPPNRAYLLFCQNSSVLCTSTAPVARPR